MTSIYSVVHLKIPNEYMTSIHDDINLKFNELCNKDLLDFQEIHNFFTKPHKLIKYHRYIFIGNYNLLDTKLSNLFKTIEQTNIISNENSTILKHLYGNDFVYKIQKICNIAKTNNEIIHFIPYSINNDDTVSTLYEIISLAFSNITIDNIHLFADRSDVIPQSFNFDIKHKIIQAAQLFRKSKKIFNMDTLKFILWSFGVPFNTIERVISSNYNTLNIDDPNDILKVLENELIQQWIKIAHIYTCPAYNITYFNHELMYPVLSNPFLYINPDKNPYYNADITDKQYGFDIIKKGFKSVILDSILPKDDTFYIYSANDFVINDENYRHAFLKLFPSLKKEIDQTNVSNLSDKYKIYNNISSSIMYFEKTAGLINIDNYDPLYLELHHRIYNIGKLDLLEIFNNIVPNKMMPLIILRDSQIKEYVYKINRTITEKKSTFDIDYPVTENDLNQWINYTSYIVDNGILKNMKDIIRGIQIKLLWKTAILNNIVRTGKIYELYKNDNIVDKTSQYCAILYNDEIIRDIPFNNKFITDYRDDMKVNDSINFYEPKKTYIDVSLDSNGHMYIKCPWKYINVYNDDKIDIFKILNQWIITMGPLFNQYLNHLYLTPPLIELSDDWFDKDSLNINRFNTYSRYINGSTYIQEFDYRYMITVPSDLRIDYDNFIKILRLLQPILVINEPVLNNNDIVDYYDVKKSSWETGFKVSEYKIDKDTYNISKGAKLITDIKRNLLRIPIKKDIKLSEKINEIHFTYKKVSDFNLLNTIQHFILRLIQSNTPEINIIEEIMNEFKLKNEEAYKEYNKYSNTTNANNVKVLTYLKFDTGIDIVIDYINVTNINDNKSLGYNILIKNVHSLMELRNISRLIEYIIHLYAYNINEKYRTDSPYIKYIQDYLIKETGITTEVIKGDEENKLEDDVNYIMDQDDINYDDMIDLENDYEELAVTEVKEEKIEEELKEDSDIKAPVRIAARTSKLVQLLKMKDFELFNWTTPKGIYYSRGCQGNKQPVVLTDEEKKRVDEEHPNAYIIDTNLMCDTRDSTFMDNLRKSSGDIKCAAIRWGSTPELQHWYICPRIYDTYSRVPLNISDLTFGKKGFIQKDNKEGWRTDRDTGDDILKFDPSYKGRKPALMKKNSIEVTEENSLIFKDSKFTPYPGFIKPIDTILDPLDPEHKRTKNLSPPIYPPCCFLVHSDGVKTLFTGISTGIRQHGDYILQWGKELDDGRYGYLNDYLNSCFGVTKCVTDKSKCIKRMGVKKGPLGFLYAISKIVGSENYENFLIKLISKLDNNLFIRLNRGALKNDFKTIGKISEFQNYIEYTLSNETKIEQYYYDLVTRAHGFYKCPNGFNLLTIEYTLNPKTDTYKYNVVIPYYTSFKTIDKINKLPTAILLHNIDNDSYEIIEYENTLLFNRGKLPHIDTMIDKMWELILRNEKPKNNIAIVNKKLKMALKYDTVLMFNDAYNYISKRYNKYECVYDGFQIIGVYIYDNKLLVPVYPTDFLDDINICSTKILLSTLIEKRNELCLTLNDYQLLISKIMNDLNKTIEYRNVYRNNSYIIGVNTSYAIYVPLKDSNIDTNLETKTDVFNIMKYMDETEKLENDSIYVKPAEYETVIDIIKKIPDNVYKLVKKGDQYIGILLTHYKKLNVNIYYPINPTNIINESTDTIIIDNDHFIEINTNMDSYIKNSNTLYNKNKNIPLRPIRLYMDENKRIFNGFILETGDIIKFNDKYGININDKLTSDILHKLLGFVNNIIMNSLADKLSSMSLNRDKPLYIDERILANKNIEYQLNVYDHLIKTINDFLKNKENDIYRQTFINIINNNNFTIQQKMRMIRPIYMGIIKILFVVSDSDNYDRCEDKKINIPSINTIDDYIYNVYFMKISNLDNNQSKLLKDKFNLESINDLYNLYKNNTNDDEIDYIKTQLIDVYNNLYMNYNNNEYCASVINNNIVNVTNLIDRLFNDFIKNRVIQDMIINKFSKIVYTDRYLQHDDEIIFRSGEGSQMWDRIKELYDKKLKLYYQSLVSLSNIKYDTEFTIELSESRKLSKCNVYKNKVSFDIVDEPIIEEVVEPIIEPVVEPVVEPIVEPLVVPIIEPIVEPIVEPVAEPVAEPEVERVVEPVAEPVAERVAEPEVERVVEPIIDSIEEIPMSILDILKEYGITEKACNTIIYATLFSNIYGNLKDIGERKTKLISFKNELDNNRLFNIDLAQLKGALYKLIYSLLVTNTCPKLNIIFKLYDNSYIHLEKEKITNDMMNNKWNIIKVTNDNNIISFIQLLKDYEYDEIDKFLS
jgi:hypothetical protein